MYCYICGRIADKLPDGLCPECLREIAENNRLVYILSLLCELYEYAPVPLRVKIEGVIQVKEIIMNHD